jgi:hypothetical protein
VAAKDKVNQVFVLKMVDGMQKKSCNRITSLANAYFSAMKILLKIEEVAMFVVSLILFENLGISWWWFAACILLPDLSMIGYLINARVGACAYNFFHHKALAIVTWFVGLYFGNMHLQFTGIMLFAHASMDRMLGYGLKYETGFRFTHLGIIGKDKPANF